MSKTLDKTDLVRAAWLTELRRQGHRQCTDTYHKSGLVCALGLLAEVAHNPVHHDITPDEVGEIAGLSHDQSFDVAARNDGTEFIDETGMVGQYKPHTFSEIADIVESWFKT